VCLDGGGMSECKSRAVLLSAKEAKTTLFKLLTRLRVRPAPAETSVAVIEHNGTLYRIEGMSSGGGR